MGILEGKVAIVTGGSRGIGFSIVEKYLEEGATVVLCGSREETAKKAVEELLKKYPASSVEGVWPDLTNYEECEKLSKEVYEKYGKIDILVNNAGISQSCPIDEYKIEEFDKIIDLNVNAVFYFTKAVVPYMKDAHDGVIINTSSMVSLYGQASGVGYPTSKFAINGMTKSLARELGKYNIRVNAVAPGVTATDMVAYLEKNMPEKLAPVKAGIPLGRVGTPEEVADAFVFLASSKASYISGAVLSVDGAARS